MLSDKLTKVAKSVTDAIMETPEHKEYVEQKKLARRNRETMSLIERSRDLQKRLMDIPEDNRNSDYAESLQEEYEEIVENTAVYDFSRAESAYVTMIQEVIGTIIENVDLDI